MSSTEETQALRLQVFLAHSGIASRRASEKFILEGRVSVNGEAVTSLGTKVLAGDTVAVDGITVVRENRFHYLVLHKPPEYMCTSFDPQGRPLAKDLLPGDISERLYNVGRLDYRSSGLILFTNDGAFAAKAGHPSRGIEKEYIVVSTVPVPASLRDDFLRGIDIDGIIYRCSDIERLDRKTLRIVLVEGKNREIRRVFSHYRLHAERLHRVRIGPVRIGDLGEGKSRRLTQEEIQALTGES